MTEAAARVEGVVDKACQEVLEELRSGLAQGVTIFLRVKIGRE
jgi:hypothetical protein